MDPVTLGILVSAASEVIGAAVQAPAAAPAYSGTAPVWLTMNAPFAVGGSGGPTSAVQQTDAAGTDKTLLLVVAGAAVLVVALWAAK